MREERNGEAEMWRKAVQVWINGEMIESGQSVLSQVWGREPIGGHSLDSRKLETLCTPRRYHSALTLRYDRLLRYSSSS